jgi:hypothetical protein
MRAPRRIRSCRCVSQVESVKGITDVKQTSLTVVLVFIPGHGTIYSRCRSATIHRRSEPHSTPVAAMDSM